LPDRILQPQRPAAALGAARLRFGGRARQESQKLLNWGFQFFDSVKLHPANQPVKAIEVWKGSSGEVKAGFRPT
jgi:D-alanyl-D-alanine carboxypeptidase